MEQKNCIKSTRKAPAVAALPAALLFFGLVCAARAQWVPPEVEVTKISVKSYAHIEEDETVVGTETELSALRAKSSASEDIARIRVVFKGKWFRGADYLAREKAAALGANYLVLLQSTGEEELGAGAVRAYRAVRLLDFNQNPLYTRPGERPPSPPQSSAPAWNPAQPAPAEQVKTPPGGHRHFAWAWRRDPYLVSHLAVFNPASAGKDETEELKAYVRENLPEKYYKKLLRALKKPASITVDFTNREIK